MKKKKKYTEEEKQNILNEFFKKLNNSQDLDPEFAKIINENFDDLIWKG
jgi:hypothetical protein